MSQRARPEHLDASELGTKDHWDSVYARELRNHAADPTDEGTVWFEDSDAEEKMIELLDTLDISAEHADPSMDTNLRIADIGTGNGHLLFSLRDNAWQAHLVGLDYSAASIKLCRNIAAARAYDTNTDRHPRDVQFEIFDVIRDTPGPWAEELFDVVLDKGTFDAISLNALPVNQGGERGCELYAAKVAQLMKPGSACLVVTSCNWTVEELKAWFSIPQLKACKTIAYPSFQFGGQKGQTVSGVCFRRVLEGEIHNNARQST